MIGDWAVGEGEFLGQWSERTSLWLDHGCVAQFDDEGIAEMWQKIAQ